MGYQEVIVQLKRHPERSLDWIILACPSGLSKRSRGLKNQLWLGHIQLSYQSTPLVIYSVESTPSSCSVLFSTHSVRLVITFVSSNFPSCVSSFLSSKTDSSQLRFLPSIFPDSPSLTEAGRPTT